MELAPSAVRSHVAREIELGRLGAIALRARVALRRASLTRRLADGADCVDSRELAMCARELTDPGTRRALASSFDLLLERARHDPPLLSSQVPIDRAKLNAVRLQLEELARRLRSAEPLDARGLAWAHLLLTDPALPLHGDASAEELSSAIIHVDQRLDAPVTEDAW